MRQNGAVPMISCSVRKSPALGASGRRCAAFLAFALLPVLSSGLDAQGEESKRGGGSHPGKESFLQFLIPSGGRYEYLGVSFTALADDASFFEANPAGSAGLSRGEVALFHHSQIQDSHTETVSFARRTQNTGYGASVRAFSSESGLKSFFSAIGTRGGGGKQGAGFVAIANASHTFCGQYRFKGVSFGCNFKMGFRKGNTNKHVTVAGDLGLRAAFSVAKNFGSNEPNMHVGLVLKNAGISVKIESSEVKPLDPAVSVGFAYRPVYAFLFSLGLQQTLNKREPPVCSVGFMLFCTHRVTLLASAACKGTGYALSGGAEIRIGSFHLDMGYRYSQIFQATFPHHVSVGLKWLIPNGGTQADQALLVKESYLVGLRFYDQRRYQEAITAWQLTLRQDPGFEPAAEGIEHARRFLKLHEKLSLFDILN
ncbi:putative membrane protein [Treponema paraluiscuniculi]|uniref:Membrane protein n=2 Tax=Treponema paraluiscuniculi TaxID=53435 RepID=A0ABY9E1L1_9SPIR|nr:UPF0164 family protein [Treponema paraluiscuniculi]WKC72415.1 putative membrane protein [Treponema paraluiscuniculi]